MDSDAPLLLGLVAFVVAGLLIYWISVEAADIIGYNRAQRAKARKTADDKWDAMVHEREEDRAVRIELLNMGFDADDIHAHRSVTVDDDGYEHATYNFPQEELRDRARHGADAHRRLTAALGGRVILGAPTHV